MVAELRNAPVMPSHLLHGYYQGEIASMCNGFQGNNLSQELQTYYNSQYDLSPSEYTQYVTKFFGTEVSQHPRLSFEREQRLVQAIEGLFDLPALAQSYGVYAPSYIEELRRIRVAEEGATEHRSLLAGALTSNTVLEYLQVVRNVFPDAAPAVMDIDGVETQLACQNNAEFIAANAAEPLAVSNHFGKFDSIHTNVLLSKIRPAKQENPSVTRQKLLDNFFHLLKPEGSLLLVEHLDEPSIHLPSSQVAAELTRTGFRNIKIKPALQFYKRRSVEQYMMELDTTEAAYVQFKTGAYPFMYFVTADKPSFEQI